MIIVDQKERFPYKTVKTRKYAEEQRPFYALAAGIVLKAVEDWDLYIARGCKYREFDELRRFFTSEWCDFLLQGIGISGVDILRVLERKLGDLR